MKNKLCINGKIEKMQYMVSIVKNDKTLMKGKNTPQCRKDVTEAYN